MMQVYRIHKEDFDRVMQHQQPEHPLSESAAGSSSSDSVVQAQMEGLATLILERMTDGVLLFGLDGQCQYANQQAGQLLGLAQDDVLGKTMAQLLPLTVVEAEKSIDQNDFFSIALGRWYQLRTFATLQGHCVSFFDITERKYSQLNALFLSDLTEAISSLSSQEELLETAGRRIAQYFSASHLTFAQVNEATNEATLLYDIHEQNVVSVAKALRISDYVSEEVQREMKARQVIVVNDLVADPRTAAYAEAFASFGVGAYLFAPHVNEGTTQLNIRPTPQRF